MGPGPGSAALRGRSMTSVMFLLTSSLSPLGRDAQGQAAGTHELSSRPSEEREVRAGGALCESRGAELVPTVIVVHGSSGPPSRSRMPPFTHEGAEPLPAALRPIRSP